ncbi:unnamed protein product [Calicophoron daubneyi]|uniref:EF-hand domain-containing protein n=1 Tax=Calicophoron daubneyi TaxID=300641 RepID=A0AAV2T1R3_CALDB
MDAFVEAFVGIDKDGSGTITFDELERYVDENNLDSIMITKWKELFDPENTGKITVEVFCEKLGLQPDAVKAKQEANVSAAKLGDDIRVISVQMSMQDQVDISNETRRLALATDPFDAAVISKKLKQYLDNKYGGIWQVIVVRGAYWMTFSHIGKRSFQFYLRGYAYVLFDSGAS